MSTKERLDVALVARGLAETRAKAQASIMSGIVYVNGQKVGKKGVVRDPAVHLEVLEHFLEHAKESRFTVLGLTYSPIRGPEGNIEYLGYLSRAEEEPPVHDLKALVEASHAVLEEKKGENDA